MSLIRGIGLERGATALAAHAKPRQRPDFHDEKFACVQKPTGWPFAVTCSDIPKDPHNTGADLTRSRLDHMINMRQQVVRAARVVTWDDLISAIGHTLPHVPEGRGRQPLPATLGDQVAVLEARL